MVAPAGYPSFPCPACGGALPATMAAGMVIPCPRCRQQIVVPAGGGPTAAQAHAYQQWALQHGNTAAAMADAQARQAAGAPGLFASTATAVVVEDGAGGVVVVGAQVGGDGRWHVRGVDPSTRQVRWEAMHGSHFQTCPDARAMCGRHGRIYVAHQGALTAIDGPTGRALWQARLGGRIDGDVDAEPVVGDEAALRELATPAGAVVVVRTDDEVVTAFDRETGQGLWQRRAEAHPQTDGAALLLREAYGVHDLVSPRDGRTIARFEVSDAALIPGAVVLAVDDRGPGGDQDGVALVDAATGQERWFVAAASVNLDLGVPVVGGELLVPRNGSAGTELLPVSPTGAAPQQGLLARLLGRGGAAARALPWPKHNVTALWAAGDALVIDAHDWDGRRRIAIVEPRAMRVRHDSGVIPDGVAPGVRIGPAGMVAYAFGDSNGPKTLRMVDAASGAARWERQLEDLDQVAFRAGHLALRTDGAPIELVDPATGQTRVRF